MLSITKMILFAAYSSTASITAQPFILKNRFKIIHRSKSVYSATPPSAHINPPQPVLSPQQACRPSFSIDPEVEKYDPGQRHYPPHDSHGYVGPTAANLREGALFSSMLIFLENPDFIYNLEARKNISKKPRVVFKEIEYSLSI